ncbi:unnamed protein product [Polarella glacialis]|uniref:SET domain-containing protein n=1 Tax=Polarella glacialis TaxID=89957 RepID=A0A813JIP5_POLGL|nr:unnamed protein product [Polarella glacialis]CAE8681016.1 unnamed protein product [Polarella glacialis]
MVEFAAVEIAATADRGNVLRATRDIKPRETVLVEKPIFATKFTNNIAKAYGDFCQLPGAVQDEILGSFFCPMGSKEASRRLRHASSLAPEDRDRAARFMTIMSFNAVEQTPVIMDTKGRDPKILHKGQTLALLRMASKASHCCAPNAFWYVRDDGRAQVIRSTTAIRKGDEVTITYLEEKKLLLPTDKRRHLLWQQKEFTCCCLRCAAEDEDTCIFQCSSAGCPGQWCLRRSGGASACLSCSFVPSESDLAFAENQETELQHQLDFCDAVERGLHEDTDARVLALKPLHARHHLTHRLASRQHAAHTRAGRHAEAVHALHLVVQCRLELPATCKSRAAAWGLEMLGHALKRAGDPFGAADAYNRACAVHLVIQDSSHPYVLYCKQVLLASVSELPPIHAGVADMDIDLHAMD